MVSPKMGIVFQITEAKMNGERYKNTLTDHVVPHLKGPSLAAECHSCALRIDRSRIASRIAYG